MTRVSGSGFGPVGFWERFVSGVVERSSSCCLSGLRRLGLWFVVVALLLVAVGAPAAAQSGPGAVPDRPAQPTVDSVSSDSVTISWAGGGDSSITGYQVLRRDRSVDAMGVFHVVAGDVSQTSYVDVTVEPSGLYNYRVKARNANGLSRRSRPVRVEVPAVPEPEPSVIETTSVPAPAPAQQAVVPDWSAVVSVGSYERSTSSMLGYSTWSRTGAVSDRDFVLDGSTYRVLVLAQLSGGLYLAISPEVPADFALSVGGEEFTASASSVPAMAGTGRYWWDAPDALFAAGDAVDVSLTTVAGSQAATRPAAPPTANFFDVPAIHNGTDAVSLRLTFSEQVTVTAATLQDDVLVVTGATITSVEQRTAGSTASWDITLQPDSNVNITVELAAVACGQTGAVCTDDDRALHNNPRATVHGPGSARLAGLSMSGLELRPVFDPSVVLYFAEAPAEATSVTVTAVAAREGTAVVIAPADADAVTAGHQVALTPNTDAAITVTTTSADGTVTLQYWVSVFVTFDPTDTTAQLDPRDSQLASLSLQGLALVGFDSDQERYELDVPAGVSETVVVAEPVDADAAMELLVVRSDDPTFTIDRNAAQGTLTASGVTLSAAGDTLALLRVTSADGFQQTVYAVLMHPSSPPSGAPSSPGASWQLRGIASLLPYLEPGPAPKASTPTAGDTTLSDLSLTDATLDEAFSPSTTSYTAQAAADTSQVTLSFTTSDTNASTAVMPGDADPDTAGWQVALIEPDVGGSPSLTAVSIIVRSADGNSFNHYAIGIHRAAAEPLAQSQGSTYYFPELLSLEVSDGTTEQDLFPSFDSDTYDYYASGRNATTSYSVTVRATTDPDNTVAVAADSTGTSVTSTTDITDAASEVIGKSAVVSLSEGVNVVKIDVTAEDDTTVWTYYVRIVVGPKSSDAELSYLRVGSGSYLTLFPELTDGEFGYDVIETQPTTSIVWVYANVPDNTSTISMKTIDSDESDASAAEFYWVSPNGGYTDSSTDESVRHQTGMLVLHDPVRAKIQITVTAQDRTTTQTYEVRFNHYNNYEVAVEDGIDYFPSLTRLVIDDDGDELDLFPSFDQYRRAYYVPGRDATDSYSVTISAETDPQNTVRFYTGSSGPNIASTEHITNSDSEIVGKSAVLDLADGMNVVWIDVVSPDITTIWTYVVHIVVGPKSDDASLYLFRLKNGGLGIHPEFDSDVTDYGVNYKPGASSSLLLHAYVLGHSARISIKPIDSDDSDTSAVDILYTTPIYLSDLSGKSARLYVHDPDRARIQITVTAEDRTTTRTYEVHLGNLPSP